MSTQARFVSNFDAFFVSLDRRKKELQLLEKRRSIFKPLQLVAISRAKRTFRESAQELWNSTRVPSFDTS